MEIPHDLTEALAKYRESLIRVTILDRDNQPVSSGQSTSNTDSSAQVFWPDDPGESDIPTSRAVNLRRSDGSQVAISDFRPCDVAHSSVHYHFRIV